MSFDAAARPRLRTALSSRTAIGLGIGAGLLGALLDASPPGRAIEHTLTHEWIIEARGPRPAPPGVVVVSMDESRADRPAVTRSDRRWSRLLYAALIERLAALGATVIVLDVAFEDEGDETGDAALEAALSRSGNVVLFRRLARSTLGDTTVPTWPRFASAARVQGVFPLPKTPDRVTYFWPFFRHFEPTGNAGEYALEEAPSLPVAALQLALLHEVGSVRFERLASTLRHAEPASDTMHFRPVGNLTEAMSSLRREMVGVDARADPRDIAENSLEKLSPATERLLHALLGVYPEPGHLLLNFYGPPGTVTTLEHGVILDAPGGSLGTARNDPVHELVRDRVVFVGHSDRTAVDQRDAYPTVYTGDDGIDLAGVEIAATAYANLVDGSTFRTLAPWPAALLHVLLGITLTLSVLRTRTGWAVAFCALFATLYFTLATYAAGSASLLLPTGVPLLVSLPLVLFGGLFHRHLVARRQRDRYQDGAGQLLPRRALDDIEAERIDRAPPVNLYGTCMITDVEGYSTVSESLTAEALAELNGEYFSILAERTRLAGGELIDLEGDSMTAVWTSAKADTDTGRLATQAAAAIVHALREFERCHPDTPFRTRIGLHAGWMAAANIGGGQTYRHRVVGDVVNTAARLETLNKRLGTSVLASRAVLAGAPSPLVRSVGTFVLKGKGEPLEIVELPDVVAGATAARQELCRRFEEVLSALASRRREVAVQRLIELSRVFGTDGPSRFYLELLRGRGPADARLDERGIVTLERT